MGSKYRLVTRSDFDGLVCAVLLKHLDLIGDISFVHPKDMQDGTIEIGPGDITTNLPYVPGAHLVFDHHESETLRNQHMASNHIIDADSPSAARVLWRHYGGHDTFPRRWDAMMDAVDKADSAQYTLEEILDLQGWVLLNTLMDSRTGLGRFRQFRISNYNLMMDLIDYCKDADIEQILELPDVRERIDLFNSYQEAFRDQLHRCSSVHENLVVLDLRNEDVIYPGSRFLIYALFPECNVSIHHLWGLRQQNNVFATGKSIFNRSCLTNIGELMLKYGGGGHAAAGTCQVDNEHAESVLQQLIAEIIANEGSAIKKSA